MPDNTDFNFGNDDYTIDFWFKTTQSGPQIALLDNSNSRTSCTNINSMEFDLDYGKLEYFGGSNSCTIYIVTSATYNDGLWHHVALVRNVTLATLYVDGINQGIDTSSSGIISGGGQSLKVGTTAVAGYYFNGYLDEIRISKGIARWTSNFTRPTAPY